MIIVENWIKKSREIRTKHLDLIEPCLERGGHSTSHRGVLAQYLNTNIPPKIDLCHACGNDNCSNPKHLYWGTRKENAKDSQQHGTYSSGWERTVKKYGKIEAKQIWRRPHLKRKG